MRKVTYGAACSLDGYIARADGGLAGLENGAVVTLAHRDRIESPVFTTARWGVVDLPLRPEPESVGPPVEP